MRDRRLLDLLKLRDFLYEFRIHSKSVICKLMAVMVEACHGEYPSLFLSAATNSFITDADLPGTVPLTYRGRLSLPLTHDMTSVIGLYMLFKLAPIPRGRTMVEAFQQFGRSRTRVTAASDDKLESLYQSERCETLLSFSKRRELFASNRWISIGGRKRVDEALEMLNQGRGTTSSSSPHWRRRGCWGCHRIGGTELTRLYRKIQQRATARSNIAGKIQKLEFF
jgi:hypothetical protein